MYNAIPSLRDLIFQYATKLKQAMVDSPTLSVEVLLMHTLSYKHKYELLVNGDYVLSEEELSYFISLFKRRLKKEPIAYIIGKKEFYSRDFFVSDKTLIPRPETEEMIEKILSSLSKNKVYTLLDIGTGSGCIALTLAKERQCIPYMLDISLPCLQMAQKNAQALGITYYFTLQADCLALPFQIASFDLIITNPPYISHTEYATLSEEVQHEPYTALCANMNGLAYVTKLIRLSYPLLKREGLFSMEFGYTQKEILQQHIKHYPWKEYIFYKDYANHDRYCIAKNR
ncbi:MAG: peptide chain release factor N(5)-glutamine methyltransferase [Desulfovibrionaceae bacterium]